MSGFEQIRPEPASFWVRWAPREWPGPEAPFLDLAHGRLAGASLRRGAGPARSPSGIADLVYRPPLAPGSPAPAALGRLQEAGHAALAQVLPGEKPPASAATVVVDPTPALLAGDLDRLDETPRGATVVWPLVPGVTDDPGLLRDGCARLRAAGATAVQGLVPTLTPVERRRLSERGGEVVYQALFHGPPATPLPLARIAVAAGLWPWLERPALGVGGRRERNRALAAHLAILAEWRLRLGHREGAAQALFRAARWADEEARDVVAVAAEGNLAVVEWLEEGARREIEGYAADGGAAAFAELTKELLAGA